MEAGSSAPSLPPPSAQNNSEPDQPPQLGSQQLVVADSDGDQLFFTFQDFTLTGSFTLPEAELRALWKSQPGDRASVGDIFRFAEAITATYRTRGYLLGFALVPPQDIRSGQFTLRLIEGQLDRLVLSGEACLLGRLKLGWQEAGRDIWLQTDSGKLRQKGALAGGEKRAAAASSFGLGSALALGEQLTMRDVASRQWHHSTQRPARADTRFYLSLAYRLAK